MIRLDLKIDQDREGVVTGKSGTRIILILAATLMIIVTVGHIALSQSDWTPFDSARPPALPSSPPPECPPLAAGQDSTRTPWGEVTRAAYDLPPGWSVISFPLARLTASEGFTRMLLHYAGGSYHTLDPRTDIEHLDTNHAYLAYCDNPSTVTVSGLENTERTCMTDLENGWNLIGCPFGQEIPWSAVLCARGKTRKSIEEAASPSIDPGDFWISSFAFNFNGNASVFDIEAPGQSMRPRRGQWIFAWHKVLLLINQSPQAAGPSVSSVTPDPLYPGAMVTISGSGFGSTPEEIIMGGIQISPETFYSWADDRVEFRLPSYVQSGPLVVSSDHAVSRPFQVTVKQLPTQEACGTIKGMISSSSGKPLPGAQIMLDEGLSATAGPGGFFTLAGVPPGQHAICVSVSGYREATGAVEVKEGAVRSLCVELSPLACADTLPFAARNPSRYSASSSPSAARRKVEGNLHIVADAYDSGSTHLWIHRIEVDEEGDDCLHWSNSWDTDLGDTYQELTCDGAVVGETYRIKITWKGKNGADQMTNTWERKLYTSDQTDTFDSPY